MRLRAIEVRNWGCIESLQLADLQGGVVILHGPNRTGKSSLVQAIRSCLFDHDHDSKDRALTTFMPWRSQETPHVAIEFEQAGQRYRLTKTFAKTKEGQASLEQAAGAGWSTLARGKEASKKARDLLGVEKSAHGIFQILWLGQQDFHLPEPGKIDSTLRKALEAVLGTLITGRDIDIQNRIDDACKRWFTPKTLRTAVDSPLTNLAIELEQARHQLEDVNRQWTDAEAALRQYEEEVARQPQLRRSLDEVETELTRLQKECESVRLRKSQHELAARSMEQCQRLLNQAEERVAAFTQTAAELDDSRRALEEEKVELAGAEAARRLAEQAADSARQSAEQSERTLAEYQQSRAVLDDRQRLVTCQTEQHACEEKLRLAESLEADRCRIEQMLAGPAVPTEAEIKELRGLRERAGLLRAKLVAGEIHVSLRVHAPLNVQVAADGDAAQEAKLAANEETRWLVRQSAELRIGDVASLRISRGEADRRLDEVAQELASLERDLHERLVAAHVDSHDPAAIDQLVARRLQHQEYTNQLRNARDAIARAAPDGIPALRARLEECDAARQAVLSRRLELAGWPPDQAELERLRFAFDGDEARLRASVLDAKRSNERQIATLDTSRSTEHSVRSRIALLEAQTRSSQERLARENGDELARAVEDAKTRLAAARQQVVDTTLSDADRDLEAQYQAAQTARTNRADRVRDSEDAILRLRTQLTGAEDLHQKRIHAEQTVMDCERELKRETLYANAHKHLKEVFEQVRQTQVKRVVGPINDRVITWARQLGLTDYDGLSFGNELLPTGLQPIHQANGEAVDMQRESYGTLEQLSLLIRLAVGGLLARTEPAVALLDDPLAHADPHKHRKMLDILASASRGEPNGPRPTGPLQIVIFTCHADRFDFLDGAQQIDLARLIRRGE
jgi:predicted ATP-dependent endonuclease of OLD family